MMLHTYTHQPMSLASINFLHLMVCEIQQEKNFSWPPPALPDTMGENDTPTALKGCGVKRKSGLVFTNNLKLSLRLKIKYNPYNLGFKL